MIVRKKHVVDARHAALVSLFAAAVTTVALPLPAGAVSRTFNVTSTVQKSCSFSSSSQTAVSLGTYDKSKGNQANYLASYNCTDGDSTYGWQFQDASLTQNTSFDMNNPSCPSETVVFTIVNGSHSFTNGGSPFVVSGEPSGLGGGSGHTVSLTFQRMVAKSQRTCTGTYTDTVTVTLTA